MAGALDVIPESRTKARTGQKVDATGRIWDPVYCAECGASGGYVTREVLWACWLCPKCEHLATVYQQQAAAGGYGLCVTPDFEVGQKLVEEQLTRYGRALTAEEFNQKMADPSDPLTMAVRKLEKDLAAIVGRR